MMTEGKPEKLSKPGWKKYQRFGEYGWILKTSQSCSAKNQRKNSPFGKKPLDTKKPLGMTKNTRNEQALNFCCHKCINKAIEHEKKRHLMFQ